MGLFSQLIQALVSVSPFFLIAAGLTSGIGVTGSANLSLGALAVLGAYLARIVAASPDPAAIALAVLAATAGPAALGAMIDIGLLRRLRGAPVLSMLATLGVALLIGALVPSRPTPLLHDWFGGAVNVFGASISIADIVQIVVGPAVFVGFLLSQRSDRGIRRSAMSAALAAGLAGLAGALLAARASSNDLEPTAGSGLLTGGILVAFLMQPAKLIRDGADRWLERPLVRATPASIRLIGMVAVAGAAVAPLVVGPSALTVLDQGLTTILFAASLQMLFGPGGMPSLGHGAFFAIGAIAAALTSDGGTAGALVAAPIAAGGVALAAGALLVWLPGVIFAMVTLALGSLTLALGSGWVSTLPPLSWPVDAALAYWFTLALCLGGVLLLRRVLSSPFGYALRASRDDPHRAVAIGVPVYAVRLAAFVIAGSLAGLAGALAMAATGRLPADLGNISLDGVLMVLLGGMQTLSGPIVGALAVTGLRQAALAVGAGWDPWLGLVLVAVVMLLPDGVAGWSIRHWRRGC